jgi:hypothetical protein
LLHLRRSSFNSSRLAATGCEAALRGFVESVAHRGGWWQPLADDYLSSSPSRFAVVAACGADEFVESDAQCGGDSIRAEDKVWK